MLTYFCASMSSELSYLDDAHYMRLRLGRELVTESRTVRLHSTEARHRASVELTLTSFHVAMKQKVNPVFL